MKRIGAAAFKARCLALLDEVGRTGEEIVVTKRGRPLARVCAEAGVSYTKFPQETLRGTVKIMGDIVRPVIPASAWKALARGG